MSTIHFTGWLFDLYPSAHGLTVWLVDGEGRKRRVSVPYVPSFYMHVADKEARRVASIISSFPFRVTLNRTTQKEIYSNEEWNVLRVNVHDTLQFKKVVQRLERHFPHYVFFNSDVPIQQLYLYNTGLFPLAFGKYHLSEDNELLSWELEDTYDAMKYTTPELSTMTIQNRPDVVSPKFRKTYQIEIGYDGTTYSIENEEPVEVLHALNHHLLRCDPDIIFTEYGDAVLMPMLTRLALQEDVMLLLNRDTSVGYFTTN